MCMYCVMYVCVVYVWCIGVKLCDVYNAALEMVERDRPELKDNFTRNAGLTHLLPRPTLTLTLATSLLLPPLQVCDRD